MDAVAVSAMLSAIRELWLKSRLRASEWRSFRILEVSLDFVLEFSALDCELCIGRPVPRTLPNHQLASTGGPQFTIRPSLSFTYVYDI